VVTDEATAISDCDQNYWRLEIPGTPLIEVKFDCRGACSLSNSQVTQVVRALEWLQTHFPAMPETAEPNCEWPNCARECDDRWLCDGRRWSGKHSGSPKSLFREIIQGYKIRFRYGECIGNGPALCMNAKGVDLTLTGRRRVEGGSWRPGGENLAWG